MLQALGELMQIQEFFDCDSAATYYSDILSEEKAIPALRSRRRSYILDYLSSFLDYPKHGEKFKRNNGRIQNTF